MQGVVKQHVMQPLVHSSYI